MSPENRLGGGRRILWTPTMDAGLGRKSDGKLSAELGISVFAVWSRRKLLDIPAFRPLTDWTPEVVSRMGAVSDEELAKELNVHAHTVGYHRRALGIAPIPKELPALPTPSESELSTLSVRRLQELYGGSCWRFLQLRRQLGIEVPRNRPGVYTKAAAPTCPPTLLPTAASAATTTSESNDNPTHNRFPD